MVQGRYLDTSPRQKNPVFLVLSPTRKDFLGLGSYLGSLNATNKRILWQNGLALWTSFIRDGMHALAMEHPSTLPGRGDITQGIDMNTRETTGLLQHATQHAMEYLLKFYYGDSLPPDLAKGLAQNTVIALFKENNVRAGGGVKGRKTAAYSKFVAGGKSTGGRLAARNADVHWRHTKGRDYFLAALRTSQRQGAQIALRTEGKQRDKRTGFALIPDSGSGEPFLVQAPFLVGGFKIKDVPAGYSDEALEFRRAYRSAFVHWLASEAESASDRSAPEVLLGRLLRKASPGGASEDSFEKIVQGIYGASFTDRTGSMDSLEGRFLDWLSRRK
jgi:hypothetical protein